MPSRGSVKPERIGRGLLWAGGMALVAWPLAVAGWSFAIEQSSVGMALPDIRSGGWEVTGSRADVRPSVTANGDVATIDFAPLSLVLTDHLTFIGADQSLTLNSLRVECRRSLRDAMVLARALTANSSLSLVLRDPTERLSMRPERSRPLRFALLATRDRASAFAARHAPMSGTFAATPIRSL